MMPFARMLPPTCFGRAFNCFCPPGRLRSVSLCSMFLTSDTRSFKTVSFTVQIQSLGWEGSDRKPKRKTEKGKRKTEKGKWVSRFPRFRFPVFSGIFRYLFPFSGFRFLVSGFLFPVFSGIFRFPVSVFRFPFSGFRFPVSGNF